MVPRLSLPAVLLTGGAVAAAGGLAVRAATPSSASSGASSSPGLGDALLLGGVFAAATGALLLGVRGAKGLGVLRDATHGQELLPHQIRSRDVKAFLADGKFKTTFYHSTSPGGYADIMANGVDVNRAQRAVYGQGISLSTRASQTYGPVAVEIAPRIRNPYVVVGDHWDAEMRDLMGLYPMRPGVDFTRGFRDPKAVSFALKAAGYDGVQVNFKDKTWLFALDAADLRVVVDGKSARNTAKYVRETAKSDAAWAIRRQARG